MGELASFDFLTSDTAGFSTAAAIDQKVEQLIRKITVGPINEIAALPLDC